jgi:hypothetical protein
MPIVSIQARGYKDTLLKKTKKEKETGCWWYMSVILAAWEAEIRTAAEASPCKNFTTLHLKQGLARVPLIKSYSGG